MDTVVDDAKCPECSVPLSINLDAPAFAEAVSSYSGGGGGGGVGAAISCNVCSAVRHSQLSSKLSRIDRL